MCLMIYVILSEGFNTEIAVRFYLMWSCKRFRPVTEKWNIVNNIK